MAERHQHNCGLALAGTIDVESATSNVNRPADARIAFPIAALLLPIYFLWDWRVGALMTSFIAVSALVAARVPGWVSMAAFFVGWAFQFYGHAVYEKKSPALFTNLIHTLVGPMWVLREAVDLLPSKK